MQSVRSRIWISVAVSISWDDNHYTTGTSISYDDNHYTTGTVWMVYHHNSDIRRLLEKKW